MSSDVEYAERGGVATITINRPEVLNAFREKTMWELIEAFDRADASTGVGVIVLTGMGSQAFSSGGDMDMENSFDQESGRRMVRILLRLSEAIRGTGKPVIAKVRGWCVGGGNELALMCDFVLASADSRFAQLDSRHGSSPVWYGTQLLPLAVGTRRAKEILMLGDVFTAAEAVSMGWINRSVPAEELDTLVGDWCTRLLGSSPQALRLTKFSVDYQADQLMPSVRHGFEVLSKMWDSAEFHEGATAFLENRAPDFGLTADG